MTQGRPGKNVAKRRSSEADKKLPVIFSSLSSFIISFIYLDIHYAYVLYYRLLHNKKFKDARGIYYLIIVNYYKIYLLAIIYYYLLMQGSQESVKGLSLGPISKGHST